MLTNFKDRNECEETGIITAMVSHMGHERAVARKDMIWRFAAGGRPLHVVEQEYCTVENFKSEQTGEKR